MTNDHPAAGVIRRVVDEIWNEENLELADLLFTADYINHGGLIPDLVRGPEAVKISVVTARLAYPGLRIVITHLVEEMHGAEVHWAARTHPKATGRARTARAPITRLTGVTFVRFEASQIIESWTFADPRSDGVVIGRRASTTEQFGRKRMNSSHRAQPAFWRAG